MNLDQALDDEGEITVADALNRMMYEASKAAVSGRHAEALEIRRLVDLLKQALCEHTSGVEPAPQRFRCVKCKKLVEPSTRTQ